MGIYIYIYTWRKNLKWGDYGDTLSGWWLTYPPEKYYTLLHFIGRPQGSVYAPAAQPEKY